MFACRNFVAFAENRNPVFAIGRVADGMFVRSEMDRRSKLQPRTFVRRQEPIADVNGVLAVKEQEALLNNNALNFEAPDGQAIFQPEFGQVMAAGQGVFRPAWLFAADLDR